MNDERSEVRMLHRHDGWVIEMDMPDADAVMIFGPMSEAAARIMLDDIRVRALAWEQNNN